MKQCPKCGNYVSDSAKFCEKCGHLFGNLPASEHATDASNFFTSIDRNCEKENKRRIIYGIILLVIFLFAGYLVYNEFGNTAHRDKSYAEKLVGVWTSEYEKNDKEENIKLFLNFTRSKPTSTNGTLAIKLLLNENTTTEKGTPYSGTYIITEEGSWNIKDGKLTISAAPETRKVATANFDYNLVSASSVNDVAEDLKSRTFTDGILNRSLTFQIVSFKDDEIIMVDNDSRYGFKKSSLQELNQVIPEDNASALQDERKTIEAQEAEHEAIQRSRIINTWRRRFVGYNYTEITDGATDLFITAYFGEPDSDGTGVGYSTCEDDVAAFSYVIVDANNVRCELKNGNVFMLQYTSNGIMFDKYKVSHQQDADGYNEFFWH